MALTQTIALLGLVLKDDNLLALAVFHHGGVHGSAFHHGGAELGRVAQDGQDLVKLDGVTGFLGQLLDEQNVAFRDLILLSAGLNDCMHCSCTSFLYHGLAVGGEARRKTVCPAHACL